MAYVYLIVDGIDSYREVGFMDISDNRPGGGWYKSEKIYGGKTIFQVREGSFTVHISDMSYTERLWSFGKSKYKRWDMAVEFDDDTVLVIELDVYAGKVHGCRYDWGEASEAFKETVKTSSVKNYPYRI